MSWRPERTLPGSLLRFANTVVSPIDRLAFEASERPANPVFIVGLPRSGTTLAYELIVQAFDVAFLTRAYAYSYGLPNITARLMQRYSGMPLPRYRSTYGRIPGWRSPAENHVFWERWFRPDRKLGHYVPPGAIGESDAAAARRSIASITAIAGRRFVFKDVYLSMSPRAILELFPDAQIVLVEREFDAVCASVLRGRARHERRTWWSIRPPFYDEEAAADNVEKTAFQCVRAKQLMDREFSQVPAQKCLRVSYADICNDPQALLQRIESRVEPTLIRRTDARIPEKFEQHEATKIPAADADRLANLCETFERDLDGYVRRVSRLANRAITPDTA